MGVTHKSKSYNMLISFHESLETCTILILAVSWLDMLNNNSNTTSGLYLSKFRLEESKLTTKIVSFTKNIPVLVIASLSVQSDYLGAWNGLRTVSKYKRSRVETILAELRYSFIRQPARPVVLESIDGVINVWLTEVFNVDWPGIMVTLGWINNNSFILEGRLDSLGNINSVVCNLFSCVAPDIMCRIVTSPEEHIRLYFISNKLEHADQSIMREITLVSTKLSSLKSRILRESIFLSAAKVVHIAFSS